MPGRWQRLALLVAWLTAAPALAQDGAAVSHRLSFPELHLQYIQVESEFPVSGGEVALLMPVWTPGSYLVRNHDSNLQILEVSDEAGRPLSVTKTRKDTWRLDSGAATRIRVTYRVHAADLNVATSWASQQFILVNGASVFLYTADSRALPQHTSVDVPDGMGHAMSAMPPLDNGWVANGFDELVDSPIVVSPAEPLRFETDGQAYAMVHVNETGLWDTERAEFDVLKVTRAANRLWRVMPFERDYWFFNLLVEASGGLEHDHSTVMMASRWQMRDRKDYIKWLGLVAHEYLHAWNVRRMRPAALQSYDYQNEQYTGSLWLAEGLTSYYDDLLLSRSKVISPAEYLEQLAAQIHRLELTPGRLKISLQQASRDAWTRLYRPDANTLNDSVSYYVKGSVVGFVLDARIREATSGRKSLDHVMREMYSRWGVTPYPEGAFSEAVAVVAGQQTADWLEPLLATPAEPDTDAALALFGLVLDRHPEKSAANLIGASLPAGFGINWSDSDNDLVVGSVVHGLSAAEAGVLPGDELLAIGDERVTRDTLENRKARLDPGEQLEFLLARQGRLLRLEVTAGEVRPATFEIRPGDGVFRERQRKRLESWLGQEVGGD